MAGPGPPPGWYRDPSGAPRQRYFDGRNWAPEAPDYRIYSLNQITLAAFPGGPFPGFWLASRNLEALGRGGTLRACLAWGVALTAANLVLAFITPDELPALVVSMGVIFGLVVLTEGF